MDKEKNIKMFKTTDSGLIERSGSFCVVLGELDEKEYDKEDVGTMYVI